MVQCSATRGPASLLKNVEALVMRLILLKYLRMCVYSKLTVCF